MIAIIDYGSGNIAAIANIYRRLDIPHFIASDPATISRASHFVLPGVGAFDVTMQHLDSSGMRDALTEEIVRKKKPVLGVCVGMQILAESSEEGIRAGLGWIPGRVKRIERDALKAPPRLPHMGWNSVEVRDGVPLVDGIDAAKGFYFLHSYYFDASQECDISATVTYGLRFPCAVAKANVFGVQFHPEKSHSNGVTLFRNFAALQAC
jgi:glutamine amidotransferase